jgi:hypothetical protein
MTLKSVLCGPLLGVLAAAVLSVDSAVAYVGPGAALGALGALWGILAAVGLAVLFVVAWPIRRMLRRRRATPEKRAEPGRGR